jgi:hypothetical protein
LIVELQQRCLDDLFAPETQVFPVSAKDLCVDRCPPKYAAKLNRVWHSRLPNAQDAPWRFAFHAHFAGVTYAVALWHNPSARGLPQDWLELRRLAIAPDAPKFTATRMLSKMAKWIRQNTDCPRLVSYQDTAVHQGTIYKAANWTHAYTSKARQRNRSVGLATRNGRMYRTDSNGKAPAASEKYRWEYNLT